jgi:Putative zinc-finger
MSWHVDAPLVADYAAGRLSPAAEASIETHMATCVGCRRVAAGYTGQAVADAVWRSVSTEIAKPPLPWWAVALRGLGVEEHELTLLASGDALRMSWAAALGTALVGLIASGLSVPAYQDTLFLLFAPLVPVAAVLAAYNATDSLRDLTDATPFSKFRLALLRTSLALAAAVPLTVSASLLAPALQPLAAVWLLPGLGLTIGTLLLLTWLTAEAAGAVVGVGWTAAIVILHSAGRIDQLAAATTQVGFAILAIGFGALLAARTSASKIRRNDR